MRRTLLALTLLVGLLVFPSSASATHDLLGFQSAVDAMLEADPTLDPPPNDGKHDFVVGGFGGGGNNVGFSAHSDPLGEEPFGHVNQTIAKPSTDTKQIRYRVICLNVAGNLAVIGGVSHPHAGSNDLPNSQVLFFFRDGGPGGSADGASSGGFPAEACTDPVFLLFATLAPPPLHGNILVHDALP